MQDKEDEFMEIISTLNETIWEHKVDRLKVEEWLINFNDEALLDISTQRIYALHLLSQFMYFGNREIRELLKYIFEDLYKYPIIRDIRKRNDDTTNIEFLENTFKSTLDQTRFLGIGNPSESGYHLLYYFRQENRLSKEYFINTPEIFKNYLFINNLKLNNIKKYIFIDDFCGSGEQICHYSKDIIEGMKKLSQDIEVS